MSSFNLVNLLIYSEYTNYCISEFYSRVIISSFFTILSPSVTIHNISLALTVKFWVVIYLSICMCELSDSLELYKDDILSGITLIKEII